MQHSDIRHMAQGYPPSKIGKDHEEVVTELATQLLEMQQKLDAVVAENKILDSAIGAIADAHETGIVDLLSREIDTAVNLERPATDAILNTVRAECVASLWSDSLRDVGRVLSEIGAYHDASEAGSIVHDEIKERVDDYIAKLRADAAKGGSDE